MSTKVISLGRATAIIAACMAVSVKAQTGQFRITNVSRSNSTTRIQWESEANWNYTVQWSASPASGSWSNLDGFVGLPGTMGTLSATDAVHSASQMFYRVQRGSPYRRTIVIDGLNDFTAGETFTTSSPGYTAYITWDSDYLYLGMQGADIASDDSHKWLLAYVSGTPGTTSGVLYNTQQPQLPFPAKYHLRWRADNAYFSAMTFDGTNWSDLGSGVAGNVSRAGGFMEWRVPLATIGNPTQFDAHICMINETSLGETSYAAVPFSSFVPGYDPDYTKYFSFNLAGSSVPNSASPLP